MSSGVDINSNAGSTLKERKPLGDNDTPNHSNETLNGKSTKPIGKTPSGQGNHVLFIVVEIAEES